MLFELLTVLATLIVAVFIFLLGYATAEIHTKAKTLDVEEIIYEPKIPKVSDVVDIKTGKPITVDEAESKINSFYR